MAYCLRMARAADLPFIVDIYNASIPGRLATADLEPVTLDSRKTWFERHQTDSQPVLVAVPEGGEAIAGWASLSEFYGRAAYAGTREVAVYVDNARQGQGVGTRLLQGLIEQAREQAIHTLLAYIFSHNTSSIGLFERHGFERWGHCPGIARMDEKAVSLDILGFKP